MQELIEIARNTPDSELIENTKLENGMYFLFDEEGNLVEEPQLKVGKEDERPWEMKYKLKQFYSTILNTNKAVYKGIATNNIYAITTWQDKFVDLDKLDSLIDNYYSLLVKKYDYDEQKANQYKGNMKKSCHYIHEHVYDYFVKVDSKTGLKSNGDIDKNRMCIYLNVPNEEYLNAFRIYLQKKIYLDDGYNISLEDMILGVPQANNTYNSKKPYVMMHTREKIAYRCDFETNYAIYKLYDWLKNQALKTPGATKSLKIKADSKSLELEDNTFAQKYYLAQGEIKSSMNGKEFVFTGLQFISLPDNEFSVTIKKDNFLQLNSNIPDIIDWSTFSEWIERDLFSYNLKKPEDTTPNDNNNSTIITHYMRYAESYRNAIKYRNFSLLRGIWSKSLTDFALDIAKVGAKNSDKKDTIYKIKMLLTIKYNFLETGIIEDGGKKMKNNLINVMDSVEEKVNSDDSHIFAESVDEYLFAVGQLARYYIGQSAAQNVTMSLADPIFSAKNKDQLTKALEQLRQKYSHSLRVYNKRLNNLTLLTTCVEFEETDTINKDFLLAGFVSNNLVYKKEENDEQDND